MLEIKFREGFLLNGDLLHSASIGFPLRMGLVNRRITITYHTPGSVMRKERPGGLSFLSHSTRGYCCLTTAVVSSNMEKIKTGLK